VVGRAGQGAPAVLTAMASALPPTVRQGDLWEGFFAPRLGDRRAARLAFFAAGVERRHAVVNPLEEDCSSWSTAARMERYAIEAVPLGKEAVAHALGTAGVAADELGLFVVVSCTGYGTPGIDILLARDLGMSSEIMRLLVGHVGCHAALPALDVARRFVGIEQRPAVVLCLELPSLHSQPGPSTLDDVVVHALFSDAASAVVLEPPAAGRRGLQILDVAAVTDPATAEHLTWEVTDLGFKMTLSRRVPDVLGDAVGPLVDRLLARNGLGRDAVDAWVVHPGGPRVLDVVAERLALTDDALESSRRVLRDHGNCSSATVLLALEDLAPDVIDRPGAHVVVAAFGPGLTLAAALLRVEGPAG
jgi:alkylresorcinol/alkylpyrone synthase